jgi:hypothetical protein
MVRVCELGSGRRCWCWGWTLEWGSGPRGTCSVLASRVEMQSDGPMSLVYKKAAKEASTIYMDRVLRSYVRDGSMYSRFDVWRRPDRNAFVDSGARGSGCAVAVDAGAGCWEPGIL